MKSEKASGFQQILKLFADFLNFNFEAEDPEVLKRKDSFNMVVLRHWRSGPEGREEAKLLQTELREDLNPIILPSMTSGPKQAYELLNALVHKIRALNLEPTWSVWPVGYTSVQVGDPEAQEYDLERSEPDASKEVYKILGPGQRKLELLGHAWIVSTRLIGKGSSSLREELYSIIIDTMESGELSRLRKCLWCTKYFAAEDLRQKYCHEECRDRADRRGAKEKRVPEYRRRQKNKKPKKAPRDPDRRAIRKFSENMDLASKKRRSSEEQSKITPWIKAYGRGNVERSWKVVNAMMKERKAGVSDKQIWEDNLA